MENQSLYQINTRIWLNELSASIGRSATLDDISDAALDELASSGFDWIYFLSVWQTGDIGRQISRSNEQWRREFESELPDLTDDDICGSGFAITKYQLDLRLGTNGALPRLRDRLHKRGMRLMLDFVPNHTALDHPWVESHPEYYVQGSSDLLARFPQNYIRMGKKQTILAHGKDPYFDGWPDTVQLNYGNQEVQQAMVNELQQIATSCDGVRCDMAMLILPDIFQRTWNITAQPFWPVAIAEVHKLAPQFVFLAEVYWDLEWELQQQGFDYTYDKRLYDRLRQGDAHTVRDHLLADLPFQEKSARFLENHDEPRVAALLPLEQHRAAAVITFLCPGLRFFHQGQLEGYTHKLSVHLARRFQEAPNPSIETFYRQLLKCLQLPVVRSGQWNLLEYSPAWDGNWTADCFIAFGWSDDSKTVLAIAVNYSSHQSQCYLQIPKPGPSGQSLRLQDLLGSAIYDRNANDLLNPGMYLDLPPWGFHVFLITVLPAAG